MGRRGGRRMGGEEKTPHPSQVRLGSRGVAKALFPPPGWTGQREGGMRKIKSSMTEAELG